MEKAIATMLVTHLFVLIVVSRPICNYAFASENTVKYCNCYTYGQNKYCHCLSIFVQQSMN